MADSTSTPQAREEQVCKEGLEEGLKKGEEKGKKDMIKSMLQAGMDIKTIADIAGISSEDVAKIVQGN